VHIVVCIKQIPDPLAPSSSFYIDEALGEPSWSPPAENVISTFDLNAIEAAARLREQTGARVTIVTVGPPETEGALRRALAAGADAAVRIEEAAAAGGDRMAIARALAACVRKLGSADLILCGRIAADWDAGHVPLMLAEMLGLPAATPVLALQLRGTEFVVERLAENGREVVLLPAPCILAVSNEINEPRYPTMRSVIEAQRAPLTEWSAADLGLGGGVGPSIRAERVYIHESESACQFVEASSAREAGRMLADVLEGIVVR